MDANRAGKGVCVYTASSSYVSAEERNNEITRGGSFNWGFRAGGLCVSCSP